MSLGELIAEKPDCTSPLWCVPGIVFSTEIFAKEKETMLHLMNMKPPAPMEASAKYDDGKAEGLTEMEPASGPTRRHL